MGTLILPRAVIDHTEEEKPLKPDGKPSTRALQFWRD
jgi:hypothetical protein